jgi:hypothetical protein
MAPVENNIFPDREVRQVNSFLENLLEPDNYRDAALVYLQKYWSTLVGNIFAAHSMPINLNKKGAWELNIAVDHSMWSQEISFQKPFIIDKINRILGLTGMEIKDFRFKTQHHASSPLIEKEIEGSAQNLKESKTLPAALDDKVKDLLDCIKDPNLKKTLYEIAILLKKNNQS